jgi:hypothetical protein
VLPALLVLTALFSLLVVARIGGARRRALVQRWPALLLAGAALVAVLRGALWPALGLAVAAGLAWLFLPSFSTRRGPAPTEVRSDPADEEARRTLGVSAAATDAEIRAAYRAKMARAHPDRGGGHAEAARLTAARDRLLKRKR